MEVDVQVRTHAQGEGDAGRGAVVEGDAAFSWTSVILPFLFPALGGLLFGYDIGATSGATISVQSADLSGTTWFNLSSVQLGLVASGSLYGALGGSILAYRIADFLGRVLYGIGIGLDVMQLNCYSALCQAMHGAPLYIAETSPSQIRGTLISLKELFIVLGILVRTIQIDNVGGWRYMFGFGAPLAAVMAIAYAGQDGEGNIWEVFEGASLKAFTIGGGLVLFQQITGQPSVLYYAASILQVPIFFSESASDAARVSVLIGLFKLLMTGVAVFKVDDVGRRPLLIGGVGGIALSLFLLAAYYKILNNFPFVAVGALLLYVGAYQVSFGPISWLMVSEIFPLRTRGRGISLAVLTNFGSNALVTFAFSPLQEFLGPENIFFLFGAIAVLSLVFVILNVPETKGLSLEEIESKILK
nr:unnamed protein product [Digitaria exilis]